MKKLIMTLAIAISSFAAFAGEENVSADVLKSFSKDFAGVSEVQWTNGNEFYKAAFIYNSQHVIAFYNTDGELLGLTRYISSLDLPINLQTNLKNEYSDYWISDLFEVSNNDGTNYYITLEKADAKIVLQSANGSKWSVYKKATKA
jgi:hypothetical protein